MSPVKHMEANSQKILEAFIDTFPHPVFIMNEHGAILLNESAKLLESQGVSFNNSFRNSDTNQSTINVKGKKFKVSKQEMNHNTGCCLFELKYEDDIAKQLRDSTKKLSLAISRR